VKRRGLRGAGAARGVAAPRISVAAGRWALAGGRRSVRCASKIRAAPPGQKEADMANSYIPTRESEMDNWLNNFKTLIAASPTTYGLAVSDATAITNAYNAWHTAYQAAINPSTRTKATVMAKNDQKANVLFVVRGFVATIQANRGVSNSLKEGLGLRVHDSTPTPVPPPNTKPVLKITRIEQGFMDVAATDEATPNKRGRPQGSAGMLLYRAVGPDSVSDPAQATFLTFVGKPAVTSTFTAADRGKTATYFARWTNARGEVGPWSQGVSVSIAA
jgi:hypothetical protein